MEPAGADWALAAGRAGAAAGGAAAPTTPGVEPPEGKGGTGKVTRSKKGTPQGGVISPLLANLYLHWFDTVFHRASGPAHWAKAKLVCYADDCVVLAPRVFRCDVSLAAFCLIPR